MAEELTETVTESTEPTPEVEPESPEPEAGLTDDASPPDVGEAVRQMNERLGTIEERLPQPESQEPPDILSILSGEAGLDEEEDEDAPFAPQGQPQQQQQQQEADEFGPDQLRQIFGEEVERGVNTVRLEIEADRREEAIRALPNEFPRLKEPEVLDQVAQRLEEMGLQPQGGFPADPRHVRMVYQAFEAEAAASGGAPAEAGGDQEATLETGAGPSVPTDDDPHAEYMRQVFGPSQHKDAFSR